MSEEAPAEITAGTEITFTFGGQDVVVSVKELDDHGNATVKFQNPWNDGSMVTTKTRAKMGGAEGETEEYEDDEHPDKNVVKMVRVPKNAGVVDHAEFRTRLEQQAMGVLNRMRAEH